MTMRLMSLASIWWGAPSRRSHRGIRQPCGQRGGRRRRLDSAGPPSVLAVAAIVWAFAMTRIVLWIVDKVIGLRVSPPEEATGLDLGELAEAAYET